MSFMLLVGKSLHNWTDLCRFLCIHTLESVGVLPHQLFGEINAAMGLLR